MKTIFYILFLLLYSGVYGQITTPVIRANFGLDGDLRANFFTGVPGNTGGDDWFNYGALTSGIGVIDTTGAAAILSRYAIDPAFRQLPFSRNMSVLPGTTVNGKLMIGALFYRDYHGSDSTMYAFGASKNGMSPADWMCPVAQSVPDKNELLDVMAHMRRDGNTINDSLWLFGGVSIEQTSGDRYFDFELYQTNLYYNKSTQKFYNYGPDLGHTSWTFDASGNIIKVGDIIFSANYGSSTLTSIEARIWVSRTTWSTVTPTNFNWSGTFDGAASGSAYGYAGIVPKTVGAFYTGLESPDNSWAGSFSLVRGDNSVVTNYTAGQFLEFAVNLTKLGIEPKTLMATFDCKTLFNRFFVKSRASTSFTAQLKDFVGPLDLFYDLKAKTTTDISKWCGLVGSTTISVTNPLPGFEYTWSTNDGHIVGTPTGDSILVDAAGTYFVNTKIQSGCTPIATDTVAIQPTNPDCIILESSIKEFAGVMSNSEVLLNWSVMNNYLINYFEIERSTDGVNFYSLGKMYSQSSNLPVVAYRFSDSAMVVKSDIIYYRIKMKNLAEKIFYSKIIRLSTDKNSASGIKIFPNPVSDNAQISITATIEENIKLSIYNVVGRLMYSIKTKLPKGNSILNVTDLKNWPDGVYTVKVNSGNNILASKMILLK